MKSQCLESQRIPDTVLQETSLKRHFWGKGPCWFWRLVTLRLNFYSIMKSLMQCKIALTEQCIFLSITSQVGHHCTKLFNFDTTRRWHAHVYSQNKHCQRQNSFKILFNLHHCMVWLRVRNTSNNLKNRSNISGKSMYHF